MRVSPVHGLLIYVYFNCTHLNTISAKTRTIVFLNTREMKTFNIYLLDYILIIFSPFNKMFQVYIFIFRYMDSILLAGCAYTGRYTLKYRT